MKAEHLPLLKSVSAPALHPDGSRVVVAVTRPDFAADSYVGQLWEVPLEEGSPRRLTRGFRDTAPRFSPDGSMLAFLRAEAGGRPQLHVADARGGEPFALTDQKLGVSEFDWSPDSTQLVFGSRVPEEGRYGTVDGVAPGAEDPRRITGFKYRMNGAGYLTDKRAQLFVVDVPDLDHEPPVPPAGRAKKDAGETPFSAVPQARQLTKADADHTGAAFTADGARILFTASLHEGADEDLISDLYAVGVDGGEPERLTNTVGNPRLSVAAGTTSADGNWLYFLAQDVSATGIDFVARNTVLWGAPIGQPAAAEPLTDAEQIDLGEAGSGLVRYGSDGVLVQNRTRGAVELLAVGPRGGTQRLLGGPLVVTGADAAAGTVVVSYSDARTAGDVGVVADGALRPLTDFSEELRGAGVIEPQEVTYPSKDGYPVHGWLLVPEGEGPHPVLLNIHGGPFAQYGWGLFDEAQVYAGAGYAVLMCNPRGAAGYGQEHGRAIKEQMGTLDLDDVLGFLEGALAAQPQLDADRVGIMGGSYGGYLTAWTIAQDHRFTAAIVERGYLDPLSFVGSSDIGWFFAEEYTGSDPDAVAAQSPMAQVGKVRTPTFVIHSEEDWRCPLEQAQRYYTALKKQGVETELLVFPGENHELSRAGTPHHRKQRFEHILQWWASYLPTAANGAES
ncbi:S9 family peptidase [Paenarthrobacter sp. DKR-5]|uniref:S9 family peptidase n=1 Tax=Paenarthrobacter sp. DKR-5 TaxID=2835535 RepID=UPI001BDC5651|nr:S9 family peptidase [Paenarthrobacter sp. DKR-5]MBT1001758.1 S9 family peptidase [Paenarthrobacter sp. DKR-5]